MTLALIFTTSMHLLVVRSRVGLKSPQRRGSVLLRAPRQCRERGVIVPLGRDALAQHDHEVARAVLGTPRTCTVEVAPGDWDGDVRSGVVLVTSPAWVQVVGATPVRVDL